MVDKGPGVVVHPARGHREADARPAARRRCSPAARPSARGSCIAWIATPPGCWSSRARRRRTGGCRRRWRSRLIEREYLALVEGRPPARSGTIEAPIGRDPRVRTRMAVGGASPREARTHFTLERALAGTSLLRLRLETGRTHQIRVHLRAIGHPVCGDPEYGTPGLLGLERQFLHATRLAFDHPLTRRARRGRLAAARRPPGGPGAGRTGILKAKSELRPVWQRIAALPGATAQEARAPGPLLPHGNQTHTTRE